MQCKDCYFLDAKMPTSRSPRTCAELGETPDSPICSSFRPRGQAANLPLAPTEVQLDPGKAIDFSYAEEFRKIYGEQLQIERDLYETGAQINAEFFQNQSSASIGGTFERYAQKLADLRLLHVLCGLFECSVYRDAVMAAEIEKQFGKPPPDMLASIQRSMKEQANAGVLRTPNQNNGTAVDSPVGGRSTKRSKRDTVPPVDTAVRTDKKS